MATKPKLQKVELIPAPMIRLGSVVTDTASGLKGMVTLLEISMDGSRQYAFQPSTLDKESRQPAKMVWLVPSRLKGGEIVIEPDLPFAVLGTQVEDTATPFKGTAISLILFMSGCVHVNVQPQGKLESGGVICTHDFDIRRLKGKALKKMTEAQKERDQKRKPSPMAFERNERPVPHPA